MAPRTQSLLFNPVRVKFTFVAATSVPAITLLICYLLWLAHGCDPFLPFISDLGLQHDMFIVFCGGLVISGLLQAATHTDACYVRFRLLQENAKTRYMHVINFLMTLSGLAISLGIGCIGFFPWDRALNPHILCASFVFFGGIAWASFNLIWQGVMSMRSKLRAYFQIALLLFGLIFLCLMVFFLKHASSNGHGLFDKLLMAENKFSRYCTDKGLDDLSISAVFEWLLISALIGSAFFLQADFSLYFAHVRTTPIDGSWIIS